MKPFKVKVKKIIKNGKVSWVIVLGVLFIVFIFGFLYHVVNAPMMAESEYKEQNGN